MESLWIEIINPKARVLLRDLANMDLIRIKKEKKKGIANLRGKLNLTKDQYNNFQKEITNAREEWERDI